MLYKGAIKYDGKETELSHNFNLQQIGLFIYLLITVL